MKIVYSSPTDVLHLFAEQSQDNARCSNVFFEGTKIWSYGRHYLLAEITGNSILINDRGYSVTTSKHVSQLRSATRQYKQFFTSQTDEKIILQSIEANLKSLINARKKEKYILPSLSLFDKLNEFREFKGIKTKSTEYKTICKLIKKLNSEDLSEYLKKEAGRIKKEKIKVAKKEAIELAIQVQKFYNYEYFRLYRNNEDYVRLSKCGDFVETSQNVKVSVKEAKILYSLIQAGKDIKGFKIGSYTVISINGTLTIGCHKINIDSMNLTGKKL